LPLTVAWKLSYAILEGLLPLLREKCGLATAATEILVDHTDNQDVAAFLAAVAQIAGQVPLQVEPIDTLTTFRQLIELLEKSHDSQNRRRRPLTNPLFEGLFS